MAIRLLEQEQSNDQVPQELRRQRVRRDRDRIRADRLADRRLHHRFSVGPRHQAERGVLRSQRRASSKPIKGSKAFSKAPARIPLAGAFLFRRLFVLRDRAQPSVARARHESPIGLWEGVPPGIADFSFQPRGVPLDCLPSRRHGRPAGRHRAFPDQQPRPRGHPAASARLVDRPEGARLPPLPRRHAFGHGDRAVPLFLARLVRFRAVAARSGRARARAPTAAFSSTSFSRRSPRSSSVSPSKSGSATPSARRRSRRSFSSPTASCSISATRSPAKRSASSTN